MAEGQNSTDIGTEVTVANYYFGEFTPIATVDSEGFISIDWPEGAPTSCRMSREVLVGMVDRLNCMRAAGDSLDEAISGVAITGTPDMMDRLMQAHGAWLEARRG